MREGFTEVKTESHFPINFYRVKVYLQLHLLPSGGLEIECSFKLLALASFLLTWKLRPCFILSVELTVNFKIE